MVVARQGSGFVLYQRHMNAGTHQAQKLLNPGARRGFGNGTDPNVGKDTQFKPGQSGNPAGKQKGTIHLSTMIQQMMNDERFIEKLSEKITDKAKLPDPEFQGTPMKAIIATALIEAFDFNLPAPQRQAARDYLAKYGYGTKVDITSKGERIAETPKIISTITARPGDAVTAQTETS